MRSIMIEGKRGGVLSILLISGLFAFGQAVADCVDYGGSDAIPLAALRGLNSAPSKAVVSGTTAFIVAGNPNIYPGLGLIAVDVSNPSSPRQIGMVQTPGTFDLAISGSTIFLAANQAGLQIVDVSNPTAPAIIGSWNDGLGNQAYGVAAAGSLVYLAYASAGLKVLDVSNPSAPTPIGGLAIPTRVLTLAGSRLYMQNGSRVYVVDVTDPTSPQVMGLVELSVIPNAMILSGTVLYVATDVGGLQVVDVSNPALPSVISQLATPTYGSSIAISGTNVYLASNGEHYGLQVIDVSNPTSPAFLGTVPGSIVAVSVSGSSLYASAVDPQQGTRGNLIIGPLQCLSSGSTTGILPGDGKGNGLGTAYPNPSLGKATMIPFSLSRPGQVSLRILDITGREVRTLLNQAMGDGNQVAKWDGRNNQGELVPTGIYFYQLRSADFEAAQRLVRVRN